MDNFIRDLIAIHYACCEKLALAKFESVLSQVSYRTIDWLAAQVDPTNRMLDIAGESPSEKNGPAPSKWQEMINKAVVAISTQEPFTPVFDTVGWDKKPTTDTIGKIRVIRLSPEKPYLLTIRDEASVEYQIAVVRRLGKPGKEGIVYRVEQSRIADGPSVPMPRAMKVYRGKKSMKAVMIEAGFQQLAARCGVAPQVYGVATQGGRLDADGPKIIMGLAGERLIDRISRQNGMLTDNQQFNLLRTALKLDACGIRHNDPNPLNFMFKASDSDEILWVDYGFSKHQQKGEFNNLMSLKTLFHGGLQGIVSRGILKPQGSFIVNGWVQKAVKQGKTLTPADITAIERGERPSIK